SALTPLVDWLSSRGAASFHFWLAGLLLPSALWTQVTVARMQAGHEFPVHLDTAQEGLAAVYDLTSAPWRPEWGGALEFPEARLALAPRFDSLFLYRPRGAADRVTPVRA